MPSVKKFDLQNLKLDYPEFQNRYRERKIKVFFYHIFFESKLRTQRAQDLKGNPPHVS